MKTLLTERELRDGVARMARAVSDAYAGRPLTIVGVLTGSIVLVADLIRQLDLPLRVGVLQTRSYEGATTTRGPLSINADMMPDVAGRDALLVDDIFDTGHTLFEVTALVKALGPRSIRSAVLLCKEGRREIDMEPDFVGFRIPDEFVVGYGMDYRDAFRHLPFVAALEPADLAGDPP